MPAYSHKRVCVCLISVSECVFIPAVNKALSPLIASSVRDKSWACELPNGPGADRELLGLPATQGHALRLFTLQTLGSRDTGRRGMRERSVLLQTPSHLNLTLWPCRNSVSPESKIGGGRGGGRQTDRQEGQGRRGEGETDRLRGSKRGRDAPFDSVCRES